MHFDAPAVQLHQLLGKRQTDTQTTGLDLVARMNASEELEDAQLHLARDTNAGVANAHAGLRAFSFRAQRDVAPMRRVLRGVVEDVLKYLRKPCWVAFELHALVRQMHCQ